MSEQGGSRAMDKVNLEAYLEKINFIVDAAYSADNGTVFSFEMGISLINDIMNLYKSDKEQSIKTEKC